jgi:hypothetical protein
LRKPAVALLLATALMSLMIASAYASTASIEAKISSANQELNVAFTFVMSNATYNILKSNSGLLNETSVPRAIQTNFVKEGHTGLTYSNPAISYNDTSKSILSTFQLSGQGVISSTNDRTAGTENFQISTIWREFSLNITDGPFFNFTQNLGTPLTAWTNSTANGIASFSYSNIVAGVSCIFELPSSAKNVALTGTTISFNVPYQVPWEDKLIDSPVLVLIALAVVGLIIFVYRKTR